MGWIVDTNVISEIIRPRPNDAVIGWIAQQGILDVSAITAEEVAFGLAWRPHPRIAAWWSTFLPERCRVHPVDAAVALRAGQLRGQLRALGFTRSPADMIVAATAALRGDTLVTRNVADFAGCGLAVFDPFRP